VTSQSSINVSADIVDQAIQEVAVRHSDLVERGIDHARSAIAGGDVGVAAHLLDVPVDGIDRIVGPRH